MTDETYTRTGEVISDRPPFAIVPDALIRDASVSPLAVRVYALLDRYADKEEHRAYPGHALLCEVLACSRATLQRTMRELVTAGWLTIAPRHRDDGSQTSNNYTLHQRSLVTTGRVTGDAPAASPTTRRAASPTTRREGESVDRESVDREKGRPRAPRKTRATPTPIGLTATASALVADVYRERSPRPTLNGGKLAMLRLVEGLLVAEWSADAIRNALMTTSGFTTNAMTIELNKQAKPARQSRGAKSANDFDEAVAALRRKDGR